VVAFLFKNEAAELSNVRTRLDQRTSLKYRQKHEVFAPLNHGRKAGWAARLLASSRWRESRKQRRQESSRSVFSPASVAQAAPGIGFFSILWTSGKGADALKCC
jgi:O-methyltransferase involved in polyketide biosynthesis